MIGCAPRTQTRRRLPGRVTVLAQPEASGLVSSRSRFPRNEWLQRHGPSLGSEICSAATRLLCPVLRYAYLQARRDALSSAETSDAPRLSGISSSESAVTVLTHALLLPGQWQAEGLPLRGSLRLVRQDVRATATVRVGAVPPNQALGQAWDRGPGCVGRDGKIVNAQS